MYQMRGRITRAQKRAVSSSPGKSRRSSRSSQSTDPSSRTPSTDSQSSTTSTTSSIDRRRSSTSSEPKVKSPSKSSKPKPSASTSSQPTTPSVQPTVIPPFQPHPSNTSFALQKEYHFLWACLCVLSFVYGWLGFHGFTVLLLLLVIIIFSKSSIWDSLNHLEQRRQRHRDKLNQQPVQDSNLEALNIVIQKLFSKMVTGQQEKYVAELLQDTLNEYKLDWMKSLSVNAFSLGSSPFRVNGVKVFQSTQNIVMDCQVTYSGDARAAIQVGIGSIGSIGNFALTFYLSDLLIEGRARVVVAMDDDGALKQISAGFHPDPLVTVSTKAVKNKLNLFQVPLLKDWLSEMITENLIKWYVLPHRYIWSFSDDSEYSEDQETELQSDDSFVRLNSQSSFSMDDEDQDQDEDDLDSETEDDFIDAAQMKFSPADYYYPSSPSPNRSRLHSTSSTSSNTSTSSSSSSRRKKQDKKTKEETTSFFKKMSAKLEENLKKLKSEGEDVSQETLQDLPELVDIAARQFELNEQLETMRHIIQRVEVLDPAHPSYSMVVEALSHDFQVHVECVETALIEIDSHLTQVTKHIGKIPLDFLTSLGVGDELNTRKLRKTADKQRQECESMMEELKMLAERDW